MTREHHRRRRRSDDEDRLARANEYKIEYVRARKPTLLLLTTESRRVWPSFLSIRSFCFCFVFFRSTIPDEDSISYLSAYSIAWVALKLVRYWNNKCLVLFFFFVSIWMGANCAYLLCSAGKSSEPPPYEVFLGGSCNPTTWRSDVAIPTLDQMGITYYNPVSLLFIIYLTAFKKLFS